MRVIEDHYALYGNAPTFKEIMKALNLKSFQGLFVDLAALHDAGYIVITRVKGWRGKGRQIALTKKRMFI